MSVFKSVSYTSKGKSKSKRLGRGYGCGVGGHTVGRGQKGQKSRGKGVVKAGFEGRQTPLYRKLPKYRGSSRRNIGVKILNIPVNLFALVKHYKTGEVVTKGTLIEKGIIGKRIGKVKILGVGNIKISLTFRNVLTSDVAAKKILAAKGKIENENS